METEMIKGEVEKVWHNKTSAGKRYDVIEVAGGRYSVWDGSGKSGDRPIFFFKTLYAAG